MEIQSHMSDGSEAEADVMPWAADGVVHDQPGGE